VSAWLIPVLTLVVGAVLSGLGTYLGLRSKVRFDYDSDLRQKRIDVYADLWRRLEPLAKYGSTSTLSGSDADALAESLRAWYFQKGGLFLSTTARTDYFALQEAIARLAEAWGWKSPDRLEMTPAAWEYLRISGSRLRTSLTRDVGTRTRPRLPGDVEPFDRSGAGVYERKDPKQQLDLRLSPLARLRLSPLARRGKPRLTLTGTGVAGPEAVTVLKWTPERASMRAKLNDPNGRPQERVLFIESGQLVEGPQPEDDTPAPPVLWKRVPVPKRR